MKHAGHVGLPHLHQWNESSGSLQHDLWASCIARSKAEAAFEPNVAAYTASAVRLQTVLEGVPNGNAPAPSCSGVEGAVLPPGVDFLGILLVGVSAWLASEARLDRRFEPNIFQRACFPRNTTRGREAALPRCERNPVDPSYTL